MLELVTEKRLRCCDTLRGQDIVAPMPFSPSDFAWWIWLLFAVGGGVVTGIFGLMASAASDESFAFICGAAAFVIGLASFGCVAIGVILFVKWVWGG